MQRRFVPRSLAGCGFPQSPDVRRFGLRNASATPGCRAHDIGRAGLAGLAGCVPRWPRSLQFSEAVGCRARWGSRVAGLAGARCRHRPIMLIMLPYLPTTSEAGAWARWSIPARRKAKRARDPIVDPGLAGRSVAGSLVATSPASPGKAGYSNNSARKDPPVGIPAALPSLRSWSRIDRSFPDIPGLCVECKPSQIP
jgi:hypothetical protein